MHKLLTAIEGENTKFFLFKIANDDCLQRSYSTKEIALSENTSKIMQKVFNDAKGECNIILFVQIQG